jgi:sarcosine oxidase gamma subunit
MPEAKLRTVPSRDIADARFRMGEEASFIQLVGFSNDFEHRLGVVLQTCVPTPIPYGRTVVAGMGTLFRTRPRRALLLLGDRTELSHAAHIAVENGLACLDLTSHWIEIAVTGGSAALGLQRLIAIDLDDDKFRPGDFAMTESHGIPILLRRTEDADSCYVVYVPRTWSQSFEAMLEDALRPLAGNVTLPGSRRSLIEAVIDAQLFG